MHSCVKATWAYLVACTILLSVGCGSGVHSVQSSALPSTPVQNPVPVAPAAPSTPTTPNSPSAPVVPVAPPVVSAPAPPPVVSAPVAPPVVSSPAAPPVVSAPAAPPVVSAPVAPAPVVSAPVAPPPATFSASATLRISGNLTLDLIGQSTQLSVSESLGSSASSDATSTAVWTVSPSGVVTITTSGVVTCIAPGNASVAASQDNATTHAEVTCVNDASTLSISPSAISANVGSTTMLVASATSRAGNSLNVMSYTAWNTGSSIVSVNPDGTMSCLQQGTTTLTASYPPLSQSVPVTCSLSSWNTPSYFLEQSDDFAGPFASWTNIRTAFGAIGDGVADDTAAIQKAFDSLNTPGSNPVLWFPAGTYLLKAPVTLTHKQYFSIVGEDPQTTIFKWAGGAGGTMLQSDASTFFRITRLTLDGSGIAAVAENIGIMSSLPGGYYTTFNELSDQHIKGVNVGIDLSVAAETTVERVLFEGISGYGLKTGNFNTLNIFIDDSLFLDCGTGVSNADGAGNFTVTNSFFARSVVADMSIGNTGYFTARHDTSVRSQAFFVAGAIGANPAQITIQNDTILDPVGIPLQLGDQGPLMVIDNVIRMQNPSLPAIQGFYDNSVSKSVFSMGNTYSTSVAARSDAADAFQGVVTAYDDTIVAPSSIPDVDIPPNVYVPPNLKRPIFEVPANAAGSVIQNQINLAVASGVEGAVVHLPAGVYHLANTLTVPVGSAIDIVGDDSYATALLWDGSGGRSALELDANKVSLKNFHLKMGRGQAVDGIQLSILDQPTSHIVVNQAQLQAGNEVSVNFDGVEHATAELFSTYTLGSATGVNVTAGPFRAAKFGALGITNFYTGSLQSENIATSFNVSKAGKFMVQDNWHDFGGTSPRNFALSGSGTVTEQAGAVYMNSSTPFEIDDFDGKVALIGLQFKGGFLMKPGHGSTQLLTLGLEGHDPDYLPQSSGNLFVENVLDEYYDTSGHQIPSQALTDTQWMRGMLAQTRSEYPAPRLPMVAEGSRTRLIRLQVDGFASALHITPSSTPTSGYYTLSAMGGTLANGTDGSELCSAVSQGGSSKSAAWMLVDAGDGDYTLSDSTGTMALSLLDGTTLRMSALNSQYGQRWIVQDLGDGRRSFKNRATNGTLTWNPGSCPQLSANNSSDASKWTLIAH